MSVSLRHRQFRLPVSPALWGASTLLALAAGQAGAKDAPKGGEPGKSGFLYNALEEYGGSAQPVFPMGSLDAWFNVIDDDSIRLQKVRSGGPLDDSGARVRDEIIGAQVGQQFVPFNRNPKEYLRVLGEAIDAAMAKGSKATLQFKLRAGREGGFAKAEPPHAGAFVAGHVIDKMTTEGKENKNEFFLRGCTDWLLKKDKAGQLHPEAPINPGLAFAGLGLMGGPNPDLETQVGKWVEAIQADWARPERKPVASPAGDQDSYGCLLHSEGWRILLLSEYNWRHPDDARKEVLQKACDELAQCLLNPSYLYKEPSYRKHDQGTKDPNNPQKEYHKDAFSYVAPSAPRFPTFHGPSIPVGGRPNPRDLAMAWWCWSSCAATSGVQLNPKALQVARQYLLDIARTKDGAGNFPVNRETAAYFAHALAFSRNKEEAAIGQSMGAMVVKSPLTLIGDQSEFGMMATCALWTRVQGTGGYRARFNEWRWYLSLMMQSEGDAHYCKLVPGLPYWEVKPLGDKEIVARGAAAFLLAAPARQLHMLGASKAAQRKGYEIGGGSGK